MSDAHLFIVGIPGMGNSDPSWHQVMASVVVLGASKHISQHLFGQVCVDLRRPGLLAEITPWRLLLTPVFVVHKVYHTMTIIILDALSLTRKKHGEP